VPKTAQRRSSVRLGQAIPAGLPDGSPGMGDEIDMATQQAPQPGLHRGSLVGMPPQWPETPPDVKGPAGRPRPQSESSTPLTLSAIWRMV
jgi:hypothetical protein